MRLSKSIKIDDKEYTVRELTVGEIIDLFSKSESDDGDNPTKDESQITMILGQIFGGAGYLKRFMKIALPGTEPHDLIKLAPSEINTIWEAVKEVNSHFFEIAQKLELGKTLTESAVEIITTFSKYAVALSNQAMEEEFSSTDTPSS